MTRTTSVILLLTALPWHACAGAATLPRPVKVPDGFEVELVAGPPLVSRPISADFDPQGRLYVTESSGSNEHVDVQVKQRPHRIVRLVDTDGDGRFDNRTVFADKMMFPEGALWHNGSLYVAAPPEIWKLTDTDDDGVADRREVWFDGKTLTHCANDLHGPYIGLDGWIYWCKGAFASQTYERPGQASLVTRAAHIFRRRPEGGSVEHVMTGGMDNPVDVVFTPTGERIFTTTFLQNPAAGKRDGLIHAIYGGVYGKQQGAIEGHPRTGELMPALVHLGAAAPCGMARLETDRLDGGFRNNLLVCQFNMHKVSRHVLVPSGASYVTRDEDFLSCEHIDFHPTDVLEDADGSVLVVDTGGWYKLCCPTSQLEKPDVLGGIYRVRRSGQQRIEDPRGKKIDWTGLSVQQLADTLGDTRPAVRRRGQGLLVARGDQAVPALAEVAQDSAPRDTRLHAIWTLTQIDGSAARTEVRAALASPDRQVRQAAIHSVALWRDREAVKNLTLLLTDESLHNRRAAAEAIGRIGDEGCVDELLAAAADYRGRVLEHSLIYALIEISSAERIELGLTAKSPHTQRAALIALDNLSGQPLQPDSIASILDSDDPVLADTAWWIAGRHPEWADTMVGFFGKQILDPDLSIGAIGQLAAQLARFAQSPKVQATMASGLSDAGVPSQTKGAILDAIATSGQKTMPAQWSAQIARLLDSENRDLVAKAVSAVHAISPSPPAPSVAARLQQVAANTKLPPEVRLQALAAGPKGEMLDDDVLRFLASELSALRPVRHRSLAVDVILAAKLSDDQLLRLAPALNGTASMDLGRLLAAFEQSTSVAVGRQLVTALAASAAATALDSGAVKQVLSRYGPSVDERAIPLIERIRAADEQRAGQLEVVMSLVPQGDIRRGQQVFNGTKAACSACHAIGYLGGKVGPDLTHIGRIRDERALLESILFPSATFVRSYEPVVIATDSGQVYSGMIKDETEQEVVLSLDAEKTVRIQRAEIEARSPGTVSVMPAGLEQQFTPQQLADLVTFLKSAQ